MLKKERWLNLHKTTWQNFSKRLNEIQNDLISPQAEDFEKVYQLTDNTYVSLVKYKTQMYVGFCQKNEEYCNRINLNTEEWKSLCDHMQAISVSLENKKGVKRKQSVKKATGVVQKKSKKKNTCEMTTNSLQVSYIEQSMDTCGAYDLQPITQYTWRIVNDKSTEVYMLSDDWTFLKEKAERKGKEALDMIPDCVPRLVVHIITHTQILPSPLDLMKMVYTHLVKKHVKQVALEKCYGCVQQLGGQKDHMGSEGCLDEYDNLLTFYMSEVMSRVTIRTTVDFISLLCTKLGVTLPVIFQEPLSENIPAITGGDVYTCSMCDNSDYEELFDSLM